MAERLRSCRRRRSSCIARSLRPPSLSEFSTSLDDTRRFLLRSSCALELAAAASLVTGRDSFDTSGCCNLVDGTAWVWSWSRSRSTPSFVMMGSCLCCAGCWPGWPDLRGAPGTVLCCCSGWLFAPTAARACDLLSCCCCWPNWISGKFRWPFMTVATLGNARLVCAFGAATVIGWGPNGVTTGSCLSRCCCCGSR